MKIAIISPNLPPDHCGVGDYVAPFAAELARQGHEVRIWTGQAAPVFIREVSIKHVARPWGLRALWRIIRELHSWEPDVINIQFTPYLYGPGSYGLRPALLPWFLRLRGLSKRARIVMTAHELHYPLGFTPDRILIGIPQLIQFYALALVSDHVFFTYDVALSKAGRILPWERKKLSLLPVGATIEPDRLDRAIKLEDERELMRLAKVPPRHKILLQFGSGHESRLFRASFEALEKVRKALGPDSASLVFVGLTQNEIESELLKAGKMDLRSLVRGTGYLKAWQVSAWMKRADLVLSPFIDGVSTRRSSIMVALAHARPVLSTRAYHSGSSTGWESFMALTPADSRQEFARRALELIENPEEAARLATAGKRKFDESFAWEKIALQFLALLG